MMKIIFAAFLSLLFFSCNNSSDEAPKEEATEIIEEGEEETIQLDFSKNFRELNEFLSEWDSSFSPDKFSQAEETQPDSSAWHAMDPETFEEFEPYFILNGDSSFALDLVSYNFIITKKKDVQRLEFAEPDTEIGLIDLKKKTRKRILFLGSSAMVLDGKWDEQGNIILAGAQDSGDGKLQPIMWRIHPSGNRMETSAYPGTIKANVSEFYRMKYKPFKTIRVV